MFKYIADDVSFYRDSDDYGPVFRMRCPKCHDVLMLCEHSIREEICDCGINWELHIDAIGIRVKKMGTNSKGAKK
jgi:hypothetical protein